jgi:hypothetical protein
MPVRQCALLGEGCAKGVETCAVVADDGTTSCVGIGPARVGESCDLDCDSAVAFRVIQGGKVALVRSAFGREFAAAL